MKTKKVLPLILLLFVAIMLFSVGMIAKEYRERQQDIKGVEKLEDIITEVEQTEMTDNVEQTETPQEQKQSIRNLTPLFESNRDCIGWIGKAGIILNHRHPPVKKRLPENRQAAYCLLYFHHL